MHLRVSVEEARRQVVSIPHKSCVKAADDNWKVDRHGSVRAQSVLWLFCWAKTGMNSEQARQVSVRVFDQILPVRFVDLDAVLEHTYARESRYASRDIEDEFKHIIERINSQSEPLVGTPGARL
jgi:hypothetical protein